MVQLCWWHSCQWQTHTRCVFLCVCVFGYVSVCFLCVLVMLFVRVVGGGSVCILPSLSLVFGRVPMSHLMRGLGLIIIQQKMKSIDWETVAGPHSQHLVGPHFQLFPYVQNISKCNSICWARNSSICQHISFMATFQTLSLPSYFRFSVTDRPLRVRYANQWEGMMLATLTLTRAHISCEKTFAGPACRKVDSSACVCVEGGRNDRAQIPGA